MNFRHKNRFNIDFTVRQTSQYIEKSLNDKGNSNNYESKKAPSMSCNFIVSCTIQQIT